MRPAIELRRRTRGPLRPSWDLDMEIFAEMTRWGGRQLIRMPLSAQRAATFQMFRQFPRSQLATTSHFVPADLPRVQGSWVHRDPAGRGPVILYLHGGGYGFGSVRMYSEIIARLADSAAANVLAIDYRLAPEARFPAQLEDSLEAYNHLLDLGVAPERVVIGGDSAGGGLAVSTLLKLRDTGAPLPAAGILFSPWLDLRNEGRSLTTNDRFDYICKPALDQYARRFAQPHEFDSPYASPMLSDMTGLPPLLVQVGSAEVLLSDARVLSDKVASAGGYVELEIYDDMIHVFQLFSAVLEPGREACISAARFAREQTRSPHLESLASPAPHYVHTQGRLRP